MPHDVATLRTRSVADLVQTARGLNIENPSGMRRPDLVAAILRAGNAPQTEGMGVLEILPDGFGFLRAPEYSFLPGPDDVYISPSQIRRFNLRNGDKLTGQVRAPKENERYFALIKVERINGEDPELARERFLFENLAAAWPDRPWLLGEDLLPVQRVAPLHRGQRGLVRGPPRSGKTSLLRALASSLAPHADVLLVLVAARPEEVAEVEEGTAGTVLATTFEEADARHVQVVDIALERARRLAEHRRDVVLLVDGLGALVRASHAVTPPTGRTFGEGLDIGALARSRRLLATGRAIRDGGSVTLLASLGSGAPADDSIARELAGTENWLVTLQDPSGADSGWPAVNPAASYVRKRT